MKVVGESCATCRFARETGAGLECRRRPPVIIPGLPEQNTAGFFPGVLSNEWCGEWEGRLARAVEPRGLG